MTSQPEWEGVKLFPIFYIILSKQNSDNRGVKHKYNYEISDENLVVISEVLILKNRNCAISFDLSDKSSYQNFALKTCFKYWPTVVFFFFFKMRIKTNRHYNK